MPLPAHLAHRAAALRSDADDRPEPSLTEEAGGVVQLAVRMPAGLRDRVHQVATSAGLSTQEWVTAVLRRAVVAASDPQVRLAERLAGEIRSELAARLDDGSYQRFVEGLDDPDLVDR